MLRIALISVHGCPLAPFSGRDVGGMNVYIHDLCLNLGRRGMAVDVFTLNHDKAADIVEELGERARVIHLAVDGPGDMPKEVLYPHLPEFAYRLNQFKEANRLHYHLLHSHYWLSGWVALSLQDCWKVPHIAMLHTLGEVKNRARPEEDETELRIETERQVIGGAHSVIATTLLEKSEMVSFYGALPDRVQVVPCGIDMDLFQPLPQEEARLALGLPSTKLLLFVGRLVPLKGLEILLHSMSQLGDGVRLAVVGGDPAGSVVGRLRRLASELGIEGRVDFLGAVEHQRLPLFYSAADICVMPSYYEHFGLVAVEALACGTPVVASGVGGLKSVVRDGETGYLVPELRPELFAERIQRLLHDDPLRKSFATAARPSVERFGWGTVIEHIIGTYQRLAGVRVAR